MSKRPFRNASATICGHKPHALVDTGGRVLKLQVHAGEVQDRDGAGPLLRAWRPSLPFVRLADAEAGNQRSLAVAASPNSVEIVPKPEGKVGFAVQARRWVVERFSAWINRRRLTKDLKATIASADAFLYAASSILLLQRLAS